MTAQPITDGEDRAPARVAQTFEHFYRTSKDEVLRAVAVARGDRDAAEEAVAEAYARAFERWAVVSLADSPRAWVVRVALNVHTSWWRRARRLVDLAAVSEAQAAVWHGSEDPRLAEAVVRLPARQREVVALRVLAGLSTHETAETLGIADGTVTAHLHRALASLRRHLAEAEGSSKNG